MRKFLLALTVVAALAVPTAASARPAAASPSIVETAIAVNSSGPYAGAFDTLICLVANNPAVLATLSQKGQYTVFAPTDDAFAKIGVDGSNCAAAASTPLVTNVLLYHVAKGRRDAVSVTTSSRIRMLNGEFTRISADGGAYFVNDARIIATDVFASNGVIHAIDKVLLPS
jgi:transforming growth factor-beta-induced protein